jgi:hypothetical protein
MSESQAGQYGPRPLPLLPLAVAGCALLVVVGSLGPWARVWFITANGTDGDGIITLLLGVAAGFFTIVRLARPGPGVGMMALAGLALLAAGVIGAIDWNDVAGITSETEEYGDLVQVGWGLVLMTIAGFAGAGLAFVQLFREQPGRPSTPAATPRLRVEPTSGRSDPFGPRPVAGRVPDPAAEAEEKAAEQAR